MDIGPKVAEIAALVGDPARANMLTSLLDGRALTASELAHVSGVSPQTASGHLAKLSTAGLLVRAQQGRHRYFRLASPRIGRMLESLMVVAEESPARAHHRWRGGEALRNARTCYDHLAGRIAVGIADSLAKRAYIVLDEDGGTVTCEGLGFLRSAGIDVPAATKRRMFCRPCLDWSERRPHIAGAVGAALLDHALNRGWVQHVRDSRALFITSDGRRALADTFDVVMEGWVKR